MIFLVVGLLLLLLGALGCILLVKNCEDWYKNVCIIIVSGCALFGGCFVLAWLFSVK